MEEERRELEEKGQSSREGTELSCWEGSPLPLKLPFVNPLPSSVWVIVLGKSSIENQALSSLYILHLR